MKTEKEISEKLAQLKLRHHVFNSNTDAAMVITLEWVLDAKPLQSSKGSEE